MESGNSMDQAMEYSEKIRDLLGEEQTWRMILKCPLSKFEPKERGVVARETLLWVFLLCLLVGEGWWSFFRFSQANNISDASALTLAIALVGAVLFTWVFGMMATLALYNFNKMRQVFGRIVIAFICCWIVSVMSFTWNILISINDLPGKLVVSRAVPSDDFDKWIDTQLAFIWFIFYGFFHMGAFLKGFLWSDIKYKRARKCRQELKDAKSGLQKEKEKEEERVASND